MYFKYFSNNTYEGININIKSYLISTLNANKISMFLRIFKGRYFFLTIVKKLYLNGKANLIF